MKLIVSVLMAIILTTSLSGCLIPLAAGAAGGIYADRNYRIEKKDGDDSSASSEAPAQEQDTSN